MGLNVGNLPVTAVYVGSTPVTAVYVGAEKVWPTQRTVSIRTHYASPNNLWTSGTQAGATDLIVYFSERYVRLSEDVTCDRPVTAATRTVAPGTVIAAGSNIYPLDWGVTFTFTTAKIRPPTEVVQITLGPGYEARDQLRAALSARGLNYNTVTEIPFEIELVGTGSAVAMFNECWSLTHVPEIDTSQVTSMAYMFSYCSSLVSVPDMDTAQVTDASYMFYNCSALTDGNVLLIGRHPNVNTTDMITGSGLTREPFYEPDDGPAIEVHEVSLTDVRGSGAIHPLLTVTVPAGETWSVRIQGTMTKAGGVQSSQPEVRIGGTTFGPYGRGEAVDCSGTVTSANTTIAIITRSGTSSNSASFVGTVTIEK